MKNKQKILLVMLEFSNWELARAWSYISSYAFINGLEKNDIEVTWLPAIVSRENNSHDILKNMEEQFPDTKFDQVWCWLVHVDYPTEFWHWTKNNAQKVIVITMESLNMSTDEFNEFPHLEKRQQYVLDQTRHCSHILCADEADVHLFKNTLNIPAIFYPLSIPEESIRYKQPEININKIAFLGAIYGNRKMYLDEENIIRMKPPENGTDLPNKFDKILEQLTDDMSKGSNCSSSMQKSLQALHEVRKALFDSYIDGIREYCGNINLPSIFKSYTGRVVDSMAAGIPVITWQLKDRPQAQALFENNTDISIYSDDKQCRQLTERLCNDSQHRDTLVVNARNKVMNGHTSRIRMRQILNWINTGKEPNYLETIGYKPTYDESKYYENLFVNTPFWNTPHPNDDEITRLTVIEEYVETLLKNNNSDRPLKILEVGCGRGWLANKLSRYGDVTAIDPIGEVINQAQVMFPHVEFITGDTELLMFLEYGASFDLVVSSEVIEHIPDQYKNKFIRQCQQLTTENGHFIISTPRGDIQQQWQEVHGIPDQPTEQWMTENALKEMCENEGFKTQIIKRTYLMDIYQIWLFKK